jgi:hypothetical protein
MSPSVIFNLHLIMGYIAWLICSKWYVFPQLNQWTQLMPNV